MGIILEEKRIQVQNVQEAIVKEEPVVQKVIEEIGSSVSQRVSDGTAMKAEQSLVGSLQAKELLAQVDRYQVGPSYDDVRSGKAEMHRGHASGSVYILQEKLTRAGFAAKPDSYFGPKTEKAVKGFQSSRGLPATGKVDQKTLQELDKAAGPSPKSNPATTSASESSSTDPAPQIKIDPSLNLPTDPYLKMAKMYDMASDRLEKGYKKGTDPGFDKMVETWVQTPSPFVDLDTPEYGKMAEAHTRFTEAAHKAGF
jgi:peptidoglycan hydrolase-like protein with peptidoglycan-binding domain